MLQIVFNIANITLSIGAAFAATSIGVVGGAEAYRPALMAAAAFIQFAVNTLIVSGVLSLLQGEQLDEIWGQWFEWSFPYYVIGAALVALLPFRGRMAQPEAWIILLPLLYLVHFFYGLSIGAKNPEATAEASLAGQSLPRIAEIYMRIALGVGALLLARALVAFDTLDPGRFVAFLALGVVASTWKIRLPGMPATISLAFVVTLFCIAEMPFSQAIVISAITCLVQVIWKAQRRPSTLQTAFSMASLAISTALAHWAVRSSISAQWTSSITATLAISTAVLFCVNTLLISAAICLYFGEAAQGHLARLLFLVVPLLSRWCRSGGPDGDDREIRRVDGVGDYPAADGYGLRVLSKARGPRSCTGRDRTGCRRDKPRGWRPGLPIRGLNSMCAIP